MKRLLFAALYITSTGFAMDKVQEKHWLQDRIDKCKQYKPGAPTTGKDGGWLKSCGFMSTYLHNFYPTLCGGQGRRPIGSGWGETYSNDSQKNVCSMISAALTDKSFVENMIDL